MIGTGWFLLGAPWDCSGSGRGEQDAPEALRAAGLSVLASRDLGDAATLIDSTRRDEQTNVLALPETIRAAECLSEILTDALRALPRLRPLVVGGDCSILLGIFAALRGSAGLWFVDGHPDYLDGWTSGTGETADMDLAVLTGIGAEPLVRLGGQKPMLSVHDVVLIGHRTQNLDESSVAEVARLPAELHRIDAGALRNDPADAGRRAADWLGAACSGAWLHIDLDVLDSDTLPAVTYPQPDGPDWEQLSAVLRPLARSPRLIGVSVADFRPDLDPTGAYATRVVQLLEDTLP